MQHPKSNIITVEDLARMVQSEFEEVSDRIARMGKRVAHLGIRLDGVERELRRR